MPSQHSHQHSLRLWFSTLALSVAAAIFLLGTNPTHAGSIRVSSGTIDTTDLAPRANELRVCKTGGTPSAPIQAAVDAATAGDIVKVAAGTYPETRDVSGAPYNLYISKTLSLQGGYTCSDFGNQNPIANVTTIRPVTADQSVVSVQGEFGQTSLVAPTIDGFTITGGGGGNHGGGISARDSNAIISRNIITGNTGYLLGGGVFVQRGAPRILYNRIENDTASSPSGTVQGGDIALEATAASVVSNIIANNRLSGTGFQGGGVDISGGGTILLANNTIVGNDADGIETDSSLTLVNTIIMSHPVGVVSTATVNPSYNIYFDNGFPTMGFSLSPTDLAVNPQLTSDYHLNAASPAIGAGTHTNAPPRDIDGETRAMIGSSRRYKIDIGADERTGTAQRTIDLDTGAADYAIIGPGGILGHSDPDANNWIGYAATSADITGDGRADLVIAAEDWAEDFNTLNATGRIFRLFNFGTRRTGTVDLYDSPSAVNLTVVSKHVRPHVGSALATSTATASAISLPARTRATMSPTILSIPLSLSSRADPHSSAHAR